MGRKKLGNVQLGCRVKSGTKKMLVSLALRLGYGSASDLLDAIADGDFVLIQKKDQKNT